MNTTTTNSTTPILDVPGSDSGGVNTNMLALIPICFAIMTVAFLIFHYYQRYKHFQAQLPQAPTDETTGQPTHVLVDDTDLDHDMDMDMYEPQLFHSADQKVTIEDISDQPRDTE